MQMKSSSESMKPLLSESISLNKARYFAPLNEFSPLMSLLRLFTRGTDAMDAMGALALHFRREEGDFELLMVDICTYLINS